MLEILRRIILPTVRRKPVFLVDVDDTLLDSKRILKDLRGCLCQYLGARNAAHYWHIVERLRRRCGCDDYFRALQTYRAEHPLDIEILRVAQFLLQYNYRHSLFPKALPIIRAIERAGGVPVLFSEGETVFQSLKIERSGLARVAKGILIYIHKDRELTSITKHFPADHYVVVDDAPHVLASIKRQWNERVTTVLTTEVGRENEPTRPLPDLTIAALAELKPSLLQKLMRPLTASR